MKNGYSIRCSIDHPILSDTSSKAKNTYINKTRIALRQWKFRRADELKVGDFVGLANNIDYWGNKYVPESYLIGLLIGDGTYSQGNSCRLISADPDTWDYIEKNNLGVINHCDDSRPEKYSKEIRTYRIIDGTILTKKFGINH
nr:MAG TPA: Intein splicing domain [Bacteriophage sp.]